MYYFQATRAYQAKLSSNKKWTRLFNLTLTTFDFHPKQHNLMNFVMCITSQISLNRIFWCNTVNEAAIASENSYYPSMTFVHCISIWYDNCLNKNKLKFFYFLPFSVCSNEKNFEIEKLDSSNAEHLNELQKIRYLSSDNAIAWSAQFSVLFEQIEMFLNGFSWYRWVAVAKETFRKFTAK